MVPWVSPLERGKFRERENIRNVQHPAEHGSGYILAEMQREATLHISSVTASAASSLSLVRSLLSCPRTARLKGPRSVLKTPDICDIHPTLPTGTYPGERAGREDFYTCSPTLHRGE